MSNEAKFAELQKIWREKPNYYAKSVHYANLHKVQKEVLNALRDSRKVVVKSCNGTGKTFLASIAAQWFLDSHTPSIVITTAPTFRQVKMLLWKEIKEKRMENEILKEFGIRGDVLDTSIKLSSNWYAIGFSTDKEDNFMGFHEKNILVIKDEASGIEDKIQAAIEGVLTSENAKQLELGNPLVKGGFFYDHFSQSTWEKFTISAFDTPNFVEFGITFDDIRDGTWKNKINKKLPYPKLITPEWVADRYAEWGEKSPLWYARVLGEFPDIGLDNLFNLKQLLAMKDGEFEIENNKTRVAGVDVARFGDDKSVIYGFVNGTEVFKDILWHKDLVTLASIIVNRIKEFRLQRICVDETGVGGGLVDILRKMKASSESDAVRECVIIGVNFAEKPNASDTMKIYRNIRAQMYFELKKFLDRRLIKFEDTNGIFNELVNIKYDFKDDGKYIIEPKDDYKKRVGHSPDESDALILAIWAMKGATSSHRSIFDIKGVTLFKREKV